MMLPSTLLTYLAQWLAAVPTFSVAADDKPSRLSFELRHLHAHAGAHVLFSDVPSAEGALAGSEYALRTRRINTHRPRSHAAFAEARRRSMLRGESALLPWDEDEVDAPDIEHRETLLLLAKMTYNAYVEPTDADWYDLGEDWTGRSPIGWEPDSDGFRGYVFATADNSTVVLSIKGTSMDLFGRGGPTAKKDKLNDNLLFSCCCARVDWTWTTVCDCYGGGWRCDTSCVQDALVEDSLFYPIGTNLYYSLAYMYPGAKIWVIGHSLGGALASLLGATFGAPVVAFESPGERMASRRLHLPQPPSTQHITHLYHTADPIAMGTCNGVFSSCYSGGYAMESQCHLGTSIVYDTISNLSWSSDVRTHTIQTVIDKLLVAPWPPALEVGREVPEPISEDECVECYSWEFGQFKNTTTSVPLIT
ncbi:alpha/beta-hydrolase [Phellopilus nigrolimitatus]|nr:alpha/beta-hydrolase [Phellopilus nigrolimitatus]